MKVTRPCGKIIRRLEVVLLPGRVEVVDEEVEAVGLEGGLRRDALFVPAEELVGVGFDAFLWSSSVKTTPFFGPAGSFSAYMRLGRRSSLALMPSRTLKTRSAVMIRLAAIQ